MRTLTRPRMQIGWRTWLGIGIVGPVVAGVAMLPSSASDVDGPVENDHGGHDHASMTAGLQDDLARVRRATARFHRVEAAEEAGYRLGWVNGAGRLIVNTCIARPAAAGGGAMGYHYFNADLMATDEVELLRPEVLVYAPDDDGRLHLAAVEWVARSATSNPPGVSTAPSVLGMPMHIIAPAPAGPAFYLTHAWVWKENPAGMFADWNPDVTCG
ncbi:MAG TPA: hypothetical protein VLA70_12375 [Nocardioides sp.]|nr:hypothetical protein [Nocardioides sp.]